MDDITKTISRLIQNSSVAIDSELGKQARAAFVDYLAAAWAGKAEPAVKQVTRIIEKRTGEVKLLGESFKTTSENAAFYLGFASHYLDYDDAQADVMGHISTVLFSALLPLVDASTSREDFFSAYVVGSELECVLGSIVNPEHKRQGYHPTATLGNLGAAAAIARLKHLSIEQTAQLLSLGATQAAGLGIEAGTDTKPLHAGFAARNAVFAYTLLTEASLTSSIRPFNNEYGWLKVVCGREITPEEIEKLWLKPGRILKPGFWMKEHCYCSAAITGLAGCKKLFTDGYSLDKLTKVVFHFPPGAAYSLHYSHPKTGQEGRFSIEYPAWMTLTQGDVDDKLFYLEQLPEEFYKALPKFERKDDLPKVAKDVRIIDIEAITEKGVSLMIRIPDPPGSPARPFTALELQDKLAAVTSRKYAEQIISSVNNTQAVTMQGLLEII